MLTLVWVNSLQDGLETTSVKRNTWVSPSPVSWLTTLWVFNSLVLTFAVSWKIPSLSFAPDGMLLDLSIHSLETTMVGIPLLKNHTDSSTSMRPPLSMSTS